MVRIDGSYGEGGGQILRTALALAVHCRRAVEVEKIRAGRKEPGLRPQHLTSILALAGVSQGKLEGAQPGSQRNSFSPGPVKSGRYSFDVSRQTRSAGSVSLVLQSLLPPLFFAPQAAQIEIKGGTHVPFSPPVHYLQLVFAPVIAGMGFRVAIDLKRWGIYPEGGGEISARIEPKTRLQPLQAAKKEDIRAVSGISVAMNLSLAVAERQKRAAEEMLAANGFRAEIETAEVPAPTGANSRGSFVLLRPVISKGAGGFSALGEKGKPAEEVGEEAARELIAFARAPGAFDPRLADQVLLYACLVPRPSEFTTTGVTEHLLTSAWVLRQFLPARITIDGEKGSPGKVTVAPG